MMLTIGVNHSGISFGMANGAVAIDKASGEFDMITNSANNSVFNCWINSIIDGYNLPVGNTVNTG